MYYLTVTEHFSAAHQLRGYKGSCEALHGHNWKVDVEVYGRKVDGIGLLLDFKDLKTIVLSVLDQLDHTFLNDLEMFTDTNPSSELLAQHIYRSVADKVPAQVAVGSVTVWESDNARARYCE